TARSRPRSAPAAGATMRAKIDVAIASRKGGSPSLGQQCLEGLGRGQHFAGVVSYPRQFDESPVESPATRLRQRLARVEYVQPALVARPPLGQDVGMIVAFVIAGITWP